MIHSPSCSDKPDRLNLITPVPGLVDRGVIEVQTASRTIRLPRAKQGIAAARARASILAATLGLVLPIVVPAACRAQSDLDAALRNYLPPSEPEISREEWQRRIEDARRRSKEVSRERREHPELYKPVPEDPDVIATERLLRDDSLQPGDIVTTKKGTFVYQGRPDQPRRDQDFVPVNPKAVR